jgi:hypothetical protein
MRILSTTLALLLSLSVIAQQRINRLSPVINHPAINVSSPFVSMDGNSLLYISDNAEDNSLAIFYSTKPDGVNWKEPALLPKHINTRLNYLRGFALAPDGRQLFVTSMKGGGLGGYDIYVADLKGTYWGELVNVGLPVNSPGNDACPSFTPDGLTMYFMRCAKMNATVAEGCKLWVAKRKTLADRWGTPEELPTTINTGNSQTPRIMGDAETLLFSSNAMNAGKGGMDLYLTRLSGGSWSKPEPLAFANTPGDDQFVSASSLGRYLMKEVPGKATTEIVELLFPPEVKPKGVMKLEAKISGPENPAAAYVTVWDKKTQTRLHNVRPSADGSVTVYLKEGAVYTLAVDPEKDNFSYATREFDLTQEKFNTRERVSIELKPVSSGDAWELAGVSFKPYTGELTPESQWELRKLIRMMNGNPTTKFAIEVAMFNYREDSVQRDADLTEVLTDTLRVPVTKMVADTTQRDTDSTFVMREITYDSMVVKNRYHNDRTPHMVLELVNYLVAQGVQAGRLLPTHTAQPATVPERKLRVTVTAR